MAKKSHSFVFTGFDIDWKYPIINQKQVRFIAYGMETAPKTGKKHHQGFLYMTNQASTSNKNCGRLGKLLCPHKPCHVEPMHGNFAQNESYCSKESTLVKLGDEPKQGLRNDLLETIQALKAGTVTMDDVAEQNPHMFNLYRRTMSYVLDRPIREKRKLYRNWPCQGEWWFGPSGVNKSRDANALLFKDPANVYKHELTDQWWDGYSGQETVIFDEFRGQLPYHRLLSLCDCYPVKVKQRNNAPFPFLAKKLIITCSKHPKDLFGNVDEGWDQFIRRFKVIHYKQKGVRVEQTENEFHSW